MDVVFDEFEEVSPISHVAAKAKSLPHGPEAEGARQKQEEYLGENAKIKEEYLKNDDDLDLVSGIDDRLVIMHVRRNHVILNQNDTQQVDYNFEHEQCLGDVLIHVNKLIRLL